MTPDTEYLVAFAGARDGYQAALALHESGRLSRLVTDAYLPDRVARILPRLPQAIGCRLERRHADGLPSKLVRSLPHIVGYRIMKEMLQGEYKALRASDDLLGRHAGRAARRAGSASLVYSYYWPGFLRGSGGNVGGSVVFQVHPVPTHIKGILAEDRARTGIDGWLDEEEVLPASVAAEFEASLRSAAGIVVPSNFVRAGLLQIGIPDHKIAVVPYGCSGPHHSGPPEENHDGALRLLWVGQASYRKGAHHLLTAFRSLPRGTATLTMVCRSGDLGLLGQLPAGTNVLAGVSAERLQQLYATHDVFVMPSLAEGFGLVYLEAMASGLPVIATGNTGIADVAGGSAGVILVPPGRAEPLADTLQALASRRGDQRTRRQAARDLASRMTWSRFRTELRSALDRLAG